VSNEPTTNPEWSSLLAQAARKYDGDADAFMRGAMSAYLDAHPGMREHLEDLQLREQLEKLRANGLMAQA
jgi:hypothetical protein